jgi:hypothetical protein
MTPCMTFWHNSRKTCAGMAGKASTFQNTNSSCFFLWHLLLSPNGLWPYRFPEHLQCTNVMGQKQHSIWCRTPRHTEALSYINNKDILLLTLRFNSTPKIGGQIEQCKILMHGHRVTFSNMWHHKVQVNFHDRSVNLRFFNTTLHCSVPELVHGNPRM